ncbi:MAG: amidohydrolase [Chloroflexi bacterium]|nr:amidohydrolase [Chloroflexota bacterium]
MQSSDLANLIFRNGHIYTLNPKRPWAEAVAVQGKAIVYVGSDYGVTKWIGHSTQVIDLKGRMLMPGFIDGHNHFVAGAFAKRGVNLLGAKNKADALARIREYVQAHPEKNLYLGFNWTFQMFGRTDGKRQDLDSVCQDKPIFLFSEDSHNGWFNTKTMEIAGINQHTPDPIPGSSYFRRDADGMPTGISIEDATMQLAMALGVIGGKAALQETMEQIFPLLAKNGITAYHDMGIFAPHLSDGYLGFELLQEWERAGKLPCRVVGVYGERDAANDPASRLQLLKDWNWKYRSELVKVTGLKIWADGTYLSHTGVQLELYADQPNTCGESDWTTETLVKWIEPAHLAGFDVHIHTDGDGAVRRCLDAFEIVAKKHGNLGRRSALHHTYIIHPDDLPRFKSIGVGVNATAAWFVNYKGDYEEALRIFGREKTEREYAIQRRLMSLGVNLTFGSDIPGTDVEELAPLYQMQAAYEGHLPGDTSTLQPPPDRLFTLEELLRAYTINGAYQMHLEDKIGSLEVGKLADLIVLEKNLFDVPKDQLCNVKVLLTMMNGRVTHEQQRLN